MRRIPILVFLALVVALLQASVGLAASPEAAPAAAPQVKVTRQVVNETVNWTMLPGDAGCKVLKRQLDGVGQRHEEIITKTFNDGTQTVIINDLVTGTATDSKGSYKFTYVNHSSDTLPGGSDTHTISMVDSFLVFGAGSPQLNISFNWRWTYPSDGSYWPPKDNWLKFSTRGDPLTCDPI